MSFKKILLAGMVSASMVTGAVAQETTLSAVSFIRLDIDWGLAFKQMVDRVNDQCVGKVKIDLRGGPETMNPFEQPVAVSNGAVDMVQTIPAFYQRMFPGALAFNLSSKGASDLRGTEGHDFIQKLHNEMVNAHFLGQAISAEGGLKFHLYLNKKEMNGTDLSGLKLRTLPIYRPMFEALGATAITMNQSELYAGLERGVVDGYGYVSWGVREQGWAPVTTHRVDPGFYAVSAVWLVNNDKWNSMSDEAKTCLQNEAIATEKLHKTMIEERTPGEYKKQEEDGIKVITLSDADAKKWLEVSVEAGWADVKAKDPENYAKLREYME